MANLRLAPRVTATKARLPRRRGSRGRSKMHTWLVAMKVAWLLERFRKRRGERSEPSVRQIALVVVSAGFAILAIRAVTRRVKTRTDSDAPAGPQGGAPPEDASTGASAGDDASTGASTDDHASTETSTVNDTVAGEDELTDRVQSEMFRHSDAPRTGSG